MINPGNANQKYLFFLLSQVNCLDELPIAVGELAILRKADEWEREILIDEFVDKDNYMNFYRWGPMQLKSVDSSKYSYELLEPEESRYFVLDPISHISNSRNLSLALQLLPDSVFISDSFGFEDNGKRKFCNMRSSSLKWSCFLGQFCGSAKM